MNLIVFDLEWNQCPDGKAHEIPQMPFEIVEIGAVRLDDRKEIIDTFRALVRPSVYEAIHPRTAEVIHLTMEELQRDGVPFPEAADAFLAWCGDDPRFCTWGTLDLMELQRNLKWYHMLNRMEGPLAYDDVQKLFALYEGKPKERKSLQDAVETLHFPEDEAFHSALDDAMYTAKILQIIPDSLIFRYYSIDSYQNPQSVEEEIRVHYDTYDKFVSREFASKDEAMEDAEVTAVRCFICHRNVRRLVHWFSNGGRNYLAVGKCPEHGLVKSKVRMHKTENGRFYVIKTTKMIREEDADRIIYMQAHLRHRRQVRRNTRGEQKK